MSDLQKDYKAKYWTLHRKFSNLIDILVFLIAIVFTYGVRFLVLANFDWYLNWSRAWDGVDIISIVFLFFTTVLSLKRIFETIYKDVI